MTYQVTVAAGLRDVVMPNGLRYQGGDQLILSDEWYANLAPAAISAHVNLGSNQEWTVVVKAGLTGISLPNQITYAGGSSVVLSDEQYSVIYAGAVSALFSSSTESGS